jgi:hypothetical protein
MLMVLKKNIGLGEGTGVAVIELIETPNLSQAGEEVFFEDQKAENQNIERRRDSQPGENVENLKNKILLVYQRQMSLITLTKEGIPVKYTFEVGSQSEFGGRGIGYESTNSDTVYIESVSDI